MSAQERRILLTAFRLRQWPAGFLEKHELGQFREFHVRADRALFVEERFAELGELEATAETRNIFALGVLVTLRHPSHPLGGDVSCNHFVDLDEDESAIAAILLVQRQHCLTCCPATGKRVENERVFVRGNLQDALYE